MDSIDWSRINAAFYEGTVLTVINKQNEEFSVSQDDEEYWVDGEDVRECFKTFEEVSSYFNDNVSRIELIDESQEEDVKVIYQR